MLKPIAIKAINSPSGRMSSTNGMTTNHSNINKNIPTLLGLDSLNSWPQLLHLYSSAPHKETAFSPQLEHFRIRTLSTRPYLVVKRNIPRQASTLGRICYAHANNRFRKEEQSFAHNHRYEHFHCRPPILDKLHLDLYSDAQ